jgi:CspA family cold shock protein
MFFTYDNDLHAHLVAQQPAPKPERPKRRKASAKRSAGTVTFFDGRKEFGFVRDDEAGCDVFIGGRTLGKGGISTLKIGDRISYAIDRKNSRGPAAIDVVLEEHAPAPTRIHQCPVCDGIGQHRWNCDLNKAA